MITAKIPKIKSNNGNTIESTSWYLLKENSKDTSSDNVIDSSIDNGVNLYEITFTKDLTLYDVFYIYVYSKYSDGSILEFPIKRVTKEDYHRELLTDIDYPVKEPKITVVKNELSSNGNLELLLSDIEPTLHRQKYVDIVIKNSRDRPIYSKRIESSSNTITIPNSDLEEHTPGEILTLYLMRITDKNLSSRPTSIEIFDLPKPVYLLSPKSNIDFHSEYSVQLSDPSLTIKSIDLYYRNKFIEHKDSNIIFGNDTYNYDATYDIYVTVDYNGDDKVLHYKLNTQANRAVYKYIKGFRFKSLKKGEQVKSTFYTTVLEQGSGDSITDFRGDDYIIMKSLRSTRNRLRSRDIHVDVDKEYYLHTISDYVSQIVYISKDDGKRYASLFTYTELGEVSNILDTTELPDNTAVTAAYSYNSEDEDIHLFTVSSNKKLIDLKSNSEIADLPEITDPSRVHVTRAYGESYVIFGDSDAFYLYDKNFKGIDNVNKIETQFKVKDWYPVRAIGGYPLYFEKQGTIILEYVPALQNFVQHNLSIPCYGVLSLRDGSYIVVDSDSKTVPIPNINNFHRVR